MKHAILAFALTILGGTAAPALADGIVIEEMRKSMPAEAMANPAAVKLFHLLEELDVLSLDDRSLFRSAQPDNAFAIDHIVFILKDEVERARTCAETEMNVRQTGPAAQRTFIFGQFLMALKSSGALVEKSDEIVETDITAEAVVMYHLAALQLTCLQDIVGG